MLKPTEALDVVIRIIKALAGRGAIVQSDHLSELGFHTREQVTQLTHAIAYHSEGVKRFGHTIDPRALNGAEPSWTVEQLAEVVFDNSIAIP